MTVQVVWFKRDLRVHDHAPLAAAALAGPVLPLWVVEPAYWRGADASARQWQVTQAAADDLAAQLAARGASLQVAVDELPAVLARLHRVLGDFALLSHEETGNAFTWARDRAVAAWCRAHGVRWRQWPQFGVWRGARLNRDRWAADWDRLMARPVVQAPSALPAAPTVFAEVPPSAAGLGLPDDGWRQRLVIGRVAAAARLRSFLQQRGEHYTREMSSPVTAAHACSRLSQDLALGTLSVREVAQAAWRRAAEVAADPAHRRWAQSTRSFIARLHWHCHFIQKLDAEPDAESRPFARLYEGLRPNPGDAARLAAWQQGRTGYPFIDAAMRYLHAHGWINFRMRAMLMSFAAYDLWLPWQQAGLHLARQFIDYEPGIHWPQCQMQAGETGINTVRIYSPVKQGHDQDPSGDFVRRWVPELAAVPGAAVHEPWRLSDGERAALCPQYPAPIVDHAQAVRLAREAIYAVRRRTDAHAEADAVQRKHGSRRRARARAASDAMPASPEQRSLDL